MPKESHLICTVEAPSIVERADEGVLERNLLFMTEFPSTLMTIVNEVCQKIALELAHLLTDGLFEKYLLCNKL